MVKSTAMGFGQVILVTVIRARGLKIKLTAMALTSGLMETNMRASGLTA